MIIGKRESKELFPLATRITQTVKHTAYEGHTWQETNDVTLDAMLAELKTCSHWHGQIVGDKLFIDSVAYSFTLYL